MTAKVCTSARIERACPELFGDAERADADPVSRLENLAWQALFRLH